MQAAACTNFSTFLAAGFGSADLAARTAQRFSREVAFNLAAQFSTFVQAAGFALRVIGITLVFCSLTKAMTTSAAVHQRNSRRFGGRVIVAIVVVTSMIAVVVIEAGVIMGSSRVGRAGGWR
jgi:hypothetical protein